MKKAGNGPLIGPKTWDLIDTGLWSQGAAVATLGAVCIDLCVEWLLGMHWAGNGRGLRVHRVNR